MATRRYFDGATIELGLLPIEAPTLTTSRLKWWNGTSWEIGSLKVWDGSAWTEFPIKFWDGGAWQA
jgi:hypothetical protein